MAVVKYNGKLYDSGFEFDTLRDIANGIRTECAKIARLLPVTDEERESLLSIRREMAKTQQSFELVNDLPLVLRKQDELRALRAEIERKYMKR